MKFKLAKSLHIKDITGSVKGIYNPIKGHNFAFISNDSFSRLQEHNYNRLNESTIEKLVEQHFLTPEIYFEKEYFMSLKKCLTNDLHLMYVLLNPSCNLKCAYCFEQAGKIEEKLMPLEIALKSIDYFFKNSIGEKKIIFYGGEPLLNEEVLVDSIKYIRTKDKTKENSTKIAIVTNGTLINRGLAQFFRHKEVEISVSIDGPKEIHDAVRIDKFGKGSYESAVKGYKILKEEKINPSISCTINKYNIHCLPQIASFFIDQLAPSSLGFNFLINQETGFNPLSCDMEKATKGLLDAFKIFRKNKVYEDRIMRRLEPITKNQVYLKNCAAYGNQIVIKYDGSIGPCHAFANSNEYFEGNIMDNKFKFNNKIFETWANRSPLNMKECNNCPAITLCGGGCAYNAKTNKGDIHSLDKQICTHTKVLLDWVLEEIWRNKSKS